MSAKILTWSRSHGVFAGLSLGGATLREDLDVNKELYGKSLTNREIVNSKMTVPAAAQPLIADLNKYSPREDR
jgi:lipid-binding SYLF domain-containing protein